MARQSRLGDACVEETAPPRSLRLSWWCLSDDIGESSNLRRALRSVARRLMCTHRLVFVGSAVLAYFPCSGAVGKHRFREEVTRVLVTGALVRGVPSRDDESTVSELQSAPEIAKSSSLAEAPVDAIDARV